MALPYIRQGSGRTASQIKQERRTQREARQTQSYSQKRRQFEDKMRILRDISS